MRHPIYPPNSSSSNSSSPPLVTVTGMWRRDVTRHREQGSMPLQVLAMLHHIRRTIAPHLRLPLPVRPIRLVLSYSVIRRSFSIASLSLLATSKLIFRTTGRTSVPLPHATDHSVCRPQASERARWRDPNSDVSNFHSSMSFIMRRFSIPPSNPPKPLRKTAE